MKLLIILQFKKNNHWIDDKCAFKKGKKALITNLLITGERHLTVR